MPFFGKLLPLAAAVLLSGCSAIVNSHLQKEEMMKAYESGDNSAVAKEIRCKLREPAWYNSSVVNSGDELMWRLEAGAFFFHVGDFKESIEQFRAAERLIAGYDDRARISVRDVSAEAGGALTNLNALPYRGFCRDRLALSIYKSLAYLGMGDESAFRAQLRRLREEQKKVQDDYREFFEKEKAELEKEKKLHPDAAGKANGATSASELAGNSENAEFRAGLDEVKRIANRGYGNFLNPAAIFLSGLGSVRDGNYSNAEIDFRRLYEAMPDNPAFQRYYATVLKKADSEPPAELRDTKGFDFPLEQDCVYVFFANGKTAAFRQIALYFPVMTAWPMCEFYPAPFEQLHLEADNRTYSTLPLADMDGILAQEFEERLPGMIARIVLGTLIREGVYYTSLALVSAADMDPLAKTLAVLAIALGGAAYRAAVNTADTRSWEILPKEFQLTQFPMPENRKISLELNGSRKICRTVEIPADTRSAILFVSAPSARNVQCHLLSLKSK